MYKNKKIAAIIPVLNEESSLPVLLKEIPEYIDWVVVADNGSTDRSVEIVKSKIHPHSISVLEPNRGYGNACMAAAKAALGADIFVYIDGDGGDDPSLLPLVLDPIILGNADFVVSNRINANLPKEAMTRFQIFGNKLAVTLIFILFRYRYKDLGPLRAISKEAYDLLEMRDPNYGWTIEMQIKALKKRLKIAQTEVVYRNRIAGVSKVSKSPTGAIKAGFKILWSVVRYTFFK